MVSMFAGARIRKRWRGSFTNSDSFTITDLQNGTRYYVQVRAHNTEEGHGGWSSTSNATPGDSISPTEAPRKPIPTALPAPTTIPQPGVTATATPIPTVTPAPTLPFQPPDRPAAPELTAGDGEIYGVITPPNDNGSWIFRYAYG